MNIRTSTWGLCAALLAVLAACGGGGGDSATMATPTTTTATGAKISATAPGATSSGAITAFGSVFVNGHEFDISKAGVVDDDTGLPGSVSSLEVGQVVDIKAASTSSDAAPAAQILHLHPLVRGYVDASTSSSITAMGQTVQLSGTTLFSDHRACVFATTSPCTAVAGASDLSVTTGSGASATPGSYVVVDGYLFNNGSGAVNVIASLVAVFDAPGTNAGPAAFKVEGSVSTASGSTIGIGGLSINLANANCFASGASTPCAGAFSVGQVVSAISATAPSLPATSFNASAALLRNRLPVTSAGSTVELQGGVSAVSSSPASFTLRGITIDASALPAGTSLPVVGDIVRVLGTVSASGTSVTATSVQILHAAASASYAFKGDASNVAPGSASNTYTLSVLGQTITVNSQTRLADFSVDDWSDEHSSSSNPFNINTFQTYLAASSSKHVLVRTAADASGNLQALSVAIVRASSVSGVAGVVDASPAPVNSTATGTPSTFSIHGVMVSADPNAIQFDRHLSSISAGDEVLAVGSFAAGTLTVGATLGHGNFVFDDGPPHDHDDPGF
jgi:hypothetical protein